MRHGTTLAAALLAFAFTPAAAQVQPGLPNANTVYAGPASGPAGPPSFRPLVPADVPKGVLTRFHFFIGNASNVAADTALAGDCTYGALGIICTSTGGTAFAPSATIDATNASNISSGTLAAARGGAGTVTGALKANGAGTVSQAACGDLTNAAPSCSTDTTNASNIATGTLGTGRLPSPFTNGTRSGNTATFATTAGTLTNGNCVKIDASGNLIDAGTTCAGGGGGTGTLISVIVYSSSQTITIPTGATKARIRMWGGTGGRGGVNTLGASGASGGTGAAGYLEKYLTGLTAGNTLVYTQGAAGAAGTNGTSPTGGGNGTASTLASGTQTISTLTANGSTGSAGTTNVSSGTAGGTASGGDLNLTGQSGTRGILSFDGTNPVYIEGRAGTTAYSVGATGASTDTSGTRAPNAGTPGGLIIEWYS